MIQISPHHIQDSFNQRAIGMTFLAVMAIAQMAIGD